MGGIREKGFFVNCDRCSKDREVTDDKHIAMYKKFAGRKERSVLMFNSVLITPDGDKVSGFEWLCPECISAVSTYLSKAAPEKTSSGSGDDQQPKKRGRKPKSQDQAAPDAKTEGEVKAQEEPQDEPDRDASPGIAAAEDDEADGGGEDDDAVDDNELFD